MGGGREEVWFFRSVFLLIGGREFSFFVPCFGCSSAGGAGIHRPGIDWDPIVCTSVGRGPVIGF